MEFKLKVLRLELGLRLGLATAVINPATCYARLRWTLRNIPHSLPQFSVGNFRTYALPHFRMTHGQRRCELLYLSTDRRTDELDLD